MAAKTSIQVLTGPSGSARMGRIDALLRDSGGRARLLVPSRTQARLRRETYLAAEGCSGAWGMPVWSLDDFAEHLLLSEGVAVTRLQAGLEERLLVEQCLARLREDGSDTMLARIPPTPGMVRHLIRVMNDLKQAAIEPEDFACRVKDVSHESPLDDSVAQVYTLFQHYLREQGLFDVPGIYWLADEFVAGGKARALDGVDTLLIDGFDDFTPSEFRLLERLLSHVGRGIIGLNLDLSPDRQDRYALTTGTLAKLRERFDCQVVECEGLSPSSYVSFAAQHVFWREAPVFPEGLKANLAVVPCSDSVHEWETAARRIKTLLVEEGVAPDDIAVVHWGMGHVAAGLRSVFRRHGVPCQARVKRPLSQTGLGRTLVNLFCNTGSWERDGILDLLSAPCLRDVLWGDGASEGGIEVVGGGGTGETSTTAHLRPVLHSDDADEGGVISEQGGTGVSPVLGAIEAAVFYMRMAQVMEGYKDTLFRLGRLREQLASGERKEAQSILKRRPHAVAEVTALLSALERLKALQDSLNGCETAHGFALALDTILARVDARTGDPDEAEAVSEIRALLELLAEGGDEAMSRADFLDAFSQGMDDASCSIPGDAGGVLCLDPEGVRGRRFAHVFVIGLMEGQAPAPPVTNAIYPEHDRERLHKAGIPLGTNQEHHAQQRMLFGHVLECATTSLTFSWAVTQDSGRESSPSPFLTDICELFPASASIMAPYPKADSFLPEVTLISGRRDLVNRALYDMPGLAVAFSDWCGPCEVGVAVEGIRHQAGPFDTFDGALQDGELVAAIAAEYGPEHEFSVAQLETYLSCPFSFFSRRILHLLDTELPEASVTPLVRGDLLHKVLQRFHQQFRGLHVCDIGLGKAVETMATLVETVVDDEQKNPATSAPPAAWQAEKLHLTERLKRYLELEIAQVKEQDWKPVHFELAFGRAVGEKDDPASVESPFVLKTKAGEVRFTGKVDRVDADEGRVRLIDYKSGAVPQSGEITRGESIQLSVYAEAVSRHVLPKTECTEARYISVGMKDRREALGIGVNKYNWPDREPNMYAAIERAVEGIRRGYFPPLRAGKSCYGCGQARACRHEESRIARKLEIENGE